MAAPRQAAAPGPTAGEAAVALTELAEAAARRPDPPAEQALAEQALAEQAGIAPVFAETRTSASTIGAGPSLTHARQHLAGTAR
jgi:hypothetical protein